VVVAIMVAVKIDSSIASANLDTMSLVAISLSTKLLIITIPTVETNSSVAGANRKATPLVAISLSANPAIITTLTLAISISTTLVITIPKPTVDIDHLTALINLV